MSRAEIASWVSSAKDFDDDDSEQPAETNSNGMTDEANWDEFVRLVRRSVLASRTKVRVGVLSEKVLAIVVRGDVSSEQVLELFDVLTLTYARYVDGPSREAAIDVLEAMLKRDEYPGDGAARKEVVNGILGWLNVEVLRVAASTSASNNIFALLTWCCAFYSAQAKNDPAFSETAEWPTLIGLLAMLLDAILDEASPGRKSLRKAALVHSRRAFRSNPDLLPKVVETILSTAKASKTPPLYAPLLGLVLDVAIRLRPTKKDKDPGGKILAGLKVPVLQFFNDYLMNAKSTVPRHARCALKDFISSSVTEDDLTTSILPTMEPSLGKGTLAAALASSAFFDAYAHPIPTTIASRLQSPVLTCLKSSNVETRQASITLFVSIIGKLAEEAALVNFTQEILALLKAGKTTGPDHRIALYKLLSSTKPSSAVSMNIVTVTLPLMVKETNETVMSSIEETTAIHFLRVAQDGVPLSPETSTLIVKEMASLKVTVRRPLSNAVGHVFWPPRDESPSPATITFLESLGKSILPALQTFLKNIAANPLANPGGPQEGYIATAIVLRWADLNAFKDALKKNTVLQSIPTSITKPSFLLLDKVYQKLATVAEEEWLIRALESAVVRFQTELQNSEPLRALVGAAFLHIATRSAHLDSRKEALASLRWLASQFSSLLHTIIRVSTVQHLRRPQGNEDDTPHFKHRFRDVLTAITSFSEAVGPEVRREVLNEWVVVTHHPEATMNPRQTWIEMLQHAALDPHQVVAAGIDRLLAFVLEASTQDSKFPHAAYLAATTLAFVAPDVVVDRLVVQLKTDLQVDELSTLGPTEYAIWETPEGTLYNDVLSTKKEATTSAKPSGKGKNQSIEQWEAELRANLAAKKATSSGSALSKEDQALVDAELAKESEIRQRVSQLQQRLTRGLAFIRSLVSARVDEFRRHITPVASLLLEDVLPKAHKLVGRQAFDTYMDLGNCCSSRLEGFNTWVGVATLRSFDSPVVPPELTGEESSSLILRVLYRLRSIAETSPFDPVTYSYTSPLVCHVILNNGVGVTEAEEIMEQVALSLNLIDFHCSECQDTLYPRRDMASALIYAIGKHSRFSKEASSSLIALGQAIEPSATVDDVNVFIRGSLADEVQVRRACLQALQPLDLTDFEWSPEIWLACHDEDEQVSKLATQVWEENGLDVRSGYEDDLMKFLGHDNEYVRRTVPSAFMEACELLPKTTSALLKSLRTLWKETAKVYVPKYDKFGILIDEGPKKADQWQARVAIARTFEQLADAAKQEDVVAFVSFLVSGRALGDQNAEVRKAILQAAIAVVDKKGEKSLQGLMGTFESYLKKSSRDDDIKEAVVILFGRAASHLSPGDPKVKTVVERLISSLKTPVEVVQAAIADSLPPLVARIPGDATRLINRLLGDLIKADAYADRRGAAFGLGGVVKGVGVAALQREDIVGKLLAAIDDAKRFQSRQGALFAIERLSAALGRLFEPYVIELIPSLLTAFGDSVADVRDATQDAAKVIMANMSGYGVKMVLPKLLTGLDEKQWRSKKGCIDLLGTMAFCAPRQLSLSLPTVVPRLTEILNDSHAQVRGAATKSLKQFGEVITNPEIRELVPILQKALVDPDKTTAGLSALLGTTFIHYVDTASLAIVVPILEKGLKSRTADSKRMAVQIVGNLAALTDARDFVPHVSLLLPLVHKVLMDPVPDVRAAAAKSLGSLIERLGENTFPDLVPGLLQTLRSDTSAIDRQGAAQGLSEVLSGLGMERMEGLLPQIIDSVRSPRPYVREGFMSLLVYLPITFGQRFTPYLGRIVQPILDGLADMEDLVRTAAMKAGRIVINNYSSKATELLLPQLLKTMFDESWRIRLSSLTLVGELLYKLTGISGKVGTDEDEEADPVIGDASRRALMEVLGKDRRDRVLAVLYLSRQDSISSVRQAAAHIWKALVSNTPRTVRDVLHPLLLEIIELLASAGPDQQESAATTMGELCRKFGEKIIGEIVPILRTCSQSPDAQTREGACLAISEVIESTTETSIEEYETQVISIVRGCLVDESAKVRAAAATAFDALQEHVGNKAIDQTIPTLLGALRQPGGGSETALQALKEVMTVRANSVFPVLIPTLITTPMTVFNANAFGQLVVVAGDALPKRLNQVLQPLAQSVETEKDDEVRDAVMDALSKLLEAVVDEEGLATLMEILLEWAKDNSSTRRATGLKLFETFCQVTEADFSGYRVDWLQVLVLLLDDGETHVVEASAAALDSFVKSIDKEDLDALVVPMRKTIGLTGAPGRHVAGFNAKSLSPMLPIILAGLTNGNSEQREHASYAISDLIEKTEEASIKPYTTQLTGPLIRVITQATTLPPAVKSGILTALTTMLDVIPAFVKPFYPQLQRTFCKSLTDPASAVVRTRAATALGSLFKSQTRVDPLVTELVTGVRSSEEAIAASIYLGLANVVRNARDSLNSASRRALAEIIDEAFAESHDETFCTAVAQLFTALAHDHEAVRDVVFTHLLAGSPPNALTSRILAEATVNSPQLFYKLRCVQPMVKMIVASVGAEESAISRPAREARETVKTQPPWVDDYAAQAVF
ncbi:translational activator of GCN4 [Tulasnella sp. 403]|nr:translational activator of GCN4 [Tulasnella sp. 403]